MLSIRHHKNQFKALNVKFLKEKGISKANTHICDSLMSHIIYSKCSL